MAASLASWSAVPFPAVSQCPGIQSSRTANAVGLGVFGCL
ncbi:hypothetical protein POX_h09380 [Penicillium oxalicum]|nr:hypothetical protein POX_h09380 [Penicillium oxalicum]KAI2785624.1 hypothetical protein POX_h09380 [Penicillium oxalicum]